MAQRLTRIATRPRAGRTEILVLVNHPMETGLRRDKESGAPIPAHFIQTLTCRINGRVAATGFLGTAVAADPLIVLRARGLQPGDRVAVDWVDNRGERGGTVARV